MNKKRQCRAPFFKISSISHFPQFPSPRDPRGSQRALPEKSQKKLRNAIYIYVSCDVEFYRVLKLFKINLDRTGALRFTLFWGGFSSRPSRPAGESEPGWARPGKPPKNRQTERSCSIEIDFGKFQDSIEFHIARNVYIAFRSFSVTF